MSILSLKNVNVEYKTKNALVHAVNNVSFDVKRQDSVGIVGESGSGKSTLAMAVLRLLPEESTSVGGEVLYKGQNLLTMQEAEFNKLRWTELAAVFQKSMNSLSAVHKVGNQLMHVYKVHNPKASREEARQRVLELFTLVNLPPRIFSLYQHELSGGMMQRVSIALGLMFNPDIIIMDEATTALDLITESQILEEILELEKKLKLTRLMITHDMSIVASTCSKIAVMYAGCLLEYGDVNEVISSPQHPYTIGLINTFPNFDGERRKIRSMEGYLPDLSNLPKGCVFAPRCHQAERICFDKRPADTIGEGGRQVSCHMGGGGVHAAI